MRQLKRSVYVIVAILMVAVALAGACATSPQPSATSPQPSATSPQPSPSPVASTPIKIGYLGPYTGICAGVGNILEKGIEWELDEQGWAVAGRKVELIKVDTASDPITTLAKTKKLVEVDNVSILLGPLLSFEQAAVASYVAKTGIPQIGLTFMNYAATIPEGSKFPPENTFFPYGTFRSTYFGGLWAYEAGFKTAIVVQTDQPDGYALCGGFIEGFEEKGGTITQIISTPIGTLDFTPYIINMKQADIITFFVQDPETAPFVSQLRDYGVKTPVFWSTIVTGGEHNLTAIGDRGLGDFGLGHYSARIDNPINNKWVKAFEAKYGHFPEEDTAPPRIAMAIALEALKLAGGDTNPKALTNVLPNVKIDTSHGLVSFGPDRIGIADFRIMKVVKIDARYYWEPIYTYSQVLQKAPSEKTR